jgi:hypothetical protein
MKKNQRIADLRARTKKLESLGGLRPAFRNAVAAANRELATDELTQATGASSGRPYRDYCVVV